LRLRSRWPGQIAFALNRLRFDADL